MVQTNKQTIKAISEILSSAAFVDQQFFQLIYPSHSVINSHPISDLQVVVVLVFFCQY